MEDGISSSPFATSSPFAFAPPMVASAPAAVRSYEQRPAHQPDIVIVVAFALFATRPEPTAATHRWSASTAADCAARQVSVLCSVVGPAPDQAEPVLYS